MSLAFRVILAFLKARFFLRVSCFSSRVIQGWLYLVVVILLQTKNNFNFLSFCQILMIFLPKCRTFYVVLEKGHGVGKKGMALEKNGMARRHAKTG